MPRLLTPASATAVELAAVQLPLRVLAMLPLRRGCQARVVPGSRAAKVALPRQCDPPRAMAALRAPVPASQLHQRSLDSQHSLNGIPSFPWPPEIAPEWGWFAGRKV
jgi:hypothetical protein